MHLESPVIGELSIYRGHCRSVVAQRH